METKDIKFYELLRELKKELYTRETKRYPTQFIESLNVVLN